MSHKSKDIVKNISIDCVVFGFENSKLNMLLVKRKRNPEKGEWALPGGFILKSETLDSAAIRVLEETSNVSNIYLEQVQTFGEVDRFPDRRVVTTTYFALINPDKHSINPGVDTIPTNPNTGSNATPAAVNPAVAASLTNFTAFILTP